jgi:HK97 family phage prohead protease
MNVQTKKPAPILTRFAPPTGSATWDKKARTLRAIISTGAPVTRRDYEGVYSERLDIAGVELAERIPVLNSHRSFDVRDVIGTVLKVERVGEQLEAVIRLSRRADVDELAADIADGITSGVSIGYAVTKWLEEESADGARTKTATEWRLVEVSIVAVPADDAARIRGQNMTITTDPAAPEATPRSRATRIATELEIRGLASVAGLRDDFVREQIEAGATLGTARAAAIDAMAERQARQPATNSHIGGDVRSDGFDNPAVRSAAMGEALALRAMPDMTPSPAARQFVGLSLAEMARESLRLAGVDVRGMSAGQVVTRSLGGLNSTSDFANALTSAAFAVLRRTYEAAPSGLKPLARRMELSDFRARTVVGVSGFSALEKVGEHGEFKRGTVEDSGETIKLETFGKIFGVTRQVIINDDLGWLTDVPKKLAIAAAAFEAQQLADLLISNPVMADGKTLFHSGHGNIAASGAAPSDVTLSAARVAMRTQKDENKQLLGLVPKALVVGAELETDAEKLMAQIAAATVDDVQPIKLAIAVEPRIAGKAWYLAADPAVSDGLAFAHLQSEPGPQIEHRVGFDVDGLEMKVRLDFGCAFVDHRGWYKNAGA